MSKHIEPPNVAMIAALLMQASPDVAKAHPYSCARDAAELCAIGRRLRKLHEVQCNGVRQSDGHMGWTEADAARNERAVEKLRARARAVFGTINAGLCLYFNRDPRGPAIKVYRLRTGQTADSDSPIAHAE